MTKNVMHDFTWFGYLSDAVNHDNIIVLTGLLIVGLFFIVGWRVQKAYHNPSDRVVPSPKTGLLGVLEVGVEMLYALLEGILGARTRHFFPLFGALFFYILVSNLIGLIPGFLPPTENVNTNYGCSLIVFFYYNYVGVKTQGLKNYLKHFMGPVIWLAPLMFVIELVSHIVRPVSLSMRLFGNIMADHMVVSKFLEFTHLVIPVIFMAVGVFVSLVQAFVFTLLSTIYLSLAVTHQEHSH